ncbi:hypothetical protein ACPV5U_08510 [Vibrio mediterranei]
MGYTPRGTQDSGRNNRQSRANHARSSSNNKSGSRNNRSSGGFSPMGGASSYGMSEKTYNNTIGRGSSDGGNHSSNSINAARLKAEREAREKAEREAREKAEREAREKAEREKAEREKAERRSRYEEKRATEAAEKKAESDRAEESGDLGFSPMGGMSSYGLSYEGGGRGVLANMRSAHDANERTIAERQNSPSDFGSVQFRSPTEQEKKAGVYNEDLAYRGDAISQDTSERGVANLVKDAVNEKGLDMATNLMTSPLGPGGKVVGKVVDWARDAFDDSTDWQKAVKDAAKDSMKSNGLINNIGSGVQAAVTYGAMNGNELAKSAAPALLNSAVTGALGIADDAVAIHNWRQKNKEYVDKHGIFDSQNSDNRDRGSRSRTNTGILNNMAPDQSLPDEKIPNVPQQELPEFIWTDGDDFNFNYGMGFRR